MLTTVPITGAVLGPNGQPLANGSLEFAISAHDTEGATNAVQVPRRTVWTLTGAGMMPAGAAQWRNTRGLRGTVYRLTARWTETDTVGALVVNRPREYVFPDAVQIGEAASYTVQQLLDNPVPDAPGFNVNLNPATYNALLGDIAATAVARNQAQTAAANALSSANAAGAQIYATAADGIAAVALNAIFYVPLATSGGLDIRRKNGASSSISIGQFLPPTQSNADTTAGRLLKVGDFGLGGSGILVSQLDDIAANGLYRIAGPDAATGNAPTGTGIWEVIHSQYDGNSAFQLASRAAFTTSVVWVRHKGGGVWGAWDRILLATDQTQTATDATAGRLLKVGDFGLGGQAIPPSAAISIDDSTLANGLYRFLGGVSGGVAPLGSEGTFLHVRRDAGVRAHQIWLSQAATAMYFRAWSGTAWTSWVQMVHSGNLLGTVSQSGGVPTGRVIERGSNANGEYVRFADGTQICTLRASASLSIGIAFMGGFRTGAQGWTYPASFAAVPSVSVTAENLTAFGAVLAAVPSATVASWAATAVTAQADTSARAVDLVAVGRWF